MVNFRLLFKKCGNTSSGGGSANNANDNQRHVKILGQVIMANKPIDVYDEIPQGWKRSDAQTTPFGYVFITNGISYFQNTRGETRGKRKTALIKDKYIWKDWNKLSKGDKAKLQKPRKLK